MALLLFAAFLLGACSAVTEEAYAGDPVALPLPEAVFVDGSSLRRGGEPVTVRAVEIGDLSLPDGRVVAMDPFSDPEREPFTAHVSAGHYPVVLSLVRPEGWPAPVIAAATIRFSLEAPVTWQLALTPGEDARQLEEGAFYGFPVDAGTACLASAEAARVLSRRMTVLGMPNLLYYVRLSREMDAHAEDGMWAMVELDRRRGLNAALFTAGWGDGVYGAYWGYDAQGEAAALVIDFGVID